MHHPDPSPQNITLTIDQSLQQAIAHHQAGRLQDAERLYRALLQAQPNHPDAHHNLGALAVQVNQPAAGLPHFKAALATNPHQEQYWLSYIDALLLAGQTHIAHEVLDYGQQQGLQANAVNTLATRLNQAVEAHNNRGNGLRGLGQLDEAEASYRRALQIKPDSSDTHYWLGNTLKGLGRHDEAEISYRQALKLKPDYANAHYNLGNMLKDLGRLGEAAHHYRRALEIRPDFSEALGNLGNTLKELGQLEEAEACYRSVLEIVPVQGSASNISELAAYNYATCLFERGLHREAVTFYQQAFAARTGLPHAVEESLSPGLVFAFVELTNKCNFHCDFCPSDSQKRALSFIDLAAVRHILDGLAEKHMVKQIDLHLMGEPTLHPNLIDILEYASNKNVKVELVTNGSTLNAKTIPRILDTLHGSLAISLQTPTSDTYKHRGETGLPWDRYIGNIRLLVREYLQRTALKHYPRTRLELRVMVTKDSKLPSSIIESLDDVLGVTSEWYSFVARLESEFGLPSWERKALNAESFAMLPGHNIKYSLHRDLSLVFWQGTTFSNSMLSSEYALEVEKTATFCSHPFTDIAFLSNGDVTLCCSDYDGNLTVGNINDDSIIDILNSKPARELRAAMLGQRPLPLFCQQCQAKVVRFPENKQKIIHRSTALNNPHGMQYP